MKQTQQNQARLIRLKTYKEALEKIQIIKELNDFNSLQPSEVTRRINEWNAYYERVRGGKAYALYQSSREALKRGDIETVKKNGLRARKALAQGWEEDLQRPPFRDPYEFYNSSDVGNYKTVCSAIENLEITQEKAPF